jgi:glycosyltransferase involved in cell wall biosynthesis
MNRFSSTIEAPALTDRDVQCEAGEDAPLGQPRRVGLDLHAVDGKFQGIRTHVIELFSRVVAISPDIEFFVYLDSVEELCNISEAFAAPNVHLEKLPYHGPLKRVYWDLPALTRKNALDMIHTQSVLPAPVSCKRLVTVHDVLYEKFPQYFSPVFRARSKVLMRYAAVHADHLFTVSEYSRNEISALYRIPAKQISVIYNGANYTRLAAPAASDAQILANRNLAANGYILSVGRLEPRKNHDTLIRAYARLEENAPPLVIAGQRDFRFTEIFERIKELHLEGRIRVFEDVNDRELPALYRHASVFAYPSFAEGFGMPVVEAMAAGAAVVASNNTGIAEIASHGEALLVNPHNVEEVAQAIRRLLNDSAFKESLIRAGRERARDFNWETAARIVRDRYLTMPLPGLRARR